MGLDDLDARVGDEHVDLRPCRDGHAATPGVHLFLVGHVHRDGQSGILEFGIDGIGGDLGGIQIQVGDGDFGPGGGIALGD